MYYNQLSGEIPRSIGTLTKLSDIRLFDNQLTGVLPPELGKHSNLWNIEVWKNRFSGSLPDGLCANGVFSSVVAHDNNLTGELPSSLIHCPTLNNIMLHRNNLSGEFPMEIWMSAVNLYYIDIQHNHFTGSLPVQLQWNMTRLVINDNNFSGKMPLSAPRLEVFNANNNMLSGEMPNLQILFLAGNRISGSIPEDISTLKFLTYLDLSNNNLSGGIPPAMESLPVLNILDLSHNRLSGSVPPEIGKLNLSILNLSYNGFSGEIPPQWQNQVYKQSFLSNPGLCSSNSTVDLNICAHGLHGDSKFSRRLIILFAVLGGVVLLLTMVVLAVIIYRRRLNDDHISLWNLTYFHSFDFTEDDIIRGITDENLIGKGGSGEVYKVIIGSRPTDVVAVKKVRSDRELDLKVQKTLESKVKILSSIQHANIVKLLCCISNGDSNLLVYEYMENGSLDHWLHGARADPSCMPHLLNWEKRLKIAIDSARGLCFMHHDRSHPTAIHRDVKSSNILLGSEFRAKIADFGFARLRIKAGESLSLSAIAGTHGHMAPEYVHSWKINEKVDVYSFGVVLLELTTGWKALNVNEEQESLVEWVGQHLEEKGKLTDLIDAELMTQGDMGHLENIGAVLKLGVKCTRDDPSSRPSLHKVLQKLMDCDRSNAGNSTFAVFKQWSKDGGNSSEASRCQEVGHGRSSTNELSA